VGRKVGPTCPAVQAQLGLDQPDAGALLDVMMLADGATAAVTGQPQARIESEATFVLGADLAGMDLDGPQVRAAVA
jgi:2-keto-4-pentenoate hydratase